MKPITPETKSSGNIFKDLGFSVLEAEKLAIKTTLMLRIETYIKAHDLTQEEAAQIMQISRSRVSDIVRGKLDKFTIDALVDILARVGYEVTVKTKEKVAA